jgi:asparagine synthase (glutamine-hydrolysing)
MCGIVGIFDGRGRRAIDRRLLERMNDSQRHRGPDDAGLFVIPGIGLGHRRLSIIDLAGGQQPLFNEDETVVVVFNGEIYNFQALATELQAAGHRFRTHSDTEVIVHAWEEWGEGCVERFRGMFAFALWDSNRETLFLGRDRLGKKPLYYASLADGTFVFSSELKALLLHDGVPRTVDPTAVEDYFAFGYVPDPKSIYRSVAKVPPAHTLAVRRGDDAPRLREYWRLRFGGGPAVGVDEVCEDLIHRLREAVRIRLISEVPLGAFLSGGVDSSGVVAMMAGLSADPVVTCSIAFGEEAYDESRFARMVSHRYGTAHHVLQVDPSAYDLVDRLIGFYDEPFADSSAIPTYHVCGLGRRSVTVALSGDGGDEVFAGYRRYRWHGYEEAVRRRLPQAVRGPLFGLLGSLYPKLDWAPKPLRAKSTLQALARDSAGGYFWSVSILTDDLRHRLYSEHLRRELQDYHAVDLVRRLMSEAPAEHALEKAQYVDFKTYLPGDILTKVDRASMAHSLEVRVPLLDHELVEWAATLPPELKLRGREGKVALKRALDPYVPHEVMYREKMGFAVPITEWFRGPLRQSVRDALTGPVLAETGLFDLGTIETLLDQHQAGQRDHSAALWALVMFESFVRKVHTASVPSMPEPERQPLSVAAG